MKEYITFSLHLQVHTTEYLFFDSACASQSICTFIGLAFIPVPRNDKLCEYIICIILYCIYCRYKYGKSMWEYLSADSKSKVKVKKVMTKNCRCDGSLEVVQGSNLNTKTCPSL